MNQPHRLAEGGSIDRAKTLRFYFNGEELSGYAGDTLASALLANDRSLVGRSMKYHRPRGIIGAGEEEPNALVGLEEGAHTLPNMRATQVALYEGLRAKSLNCWPSVRWDMGALVGLLAPLLPAGFYYKTFMWPARGWRFYEHFIRRIAGLGVAPNAPDPDIYDKIYAHVDVLVIGAGPCGLLAALEATRGHARVMLVEQDSELGGHLLSSQTMMDARPGLAWVDAMRRELETHPEARVLTRTTATGYYDNNFLILVQRCTEHLPVDSRSGPRERLWRVRAKRVILATGALERPMVFPDNDRPGVMLLSAAQSYAHRFAVLPNKEAVILTNNDSAYLAASELSDRGLAVARIVDTRQAIGASARALVEARNISVSTSQTIHRVHGRSRIRGVTLGPVNATDGKSNTTYLRSELVLVSGGWNPTVHLHAQSGAKPVYAEDIASFVPGKSVQKEDSIGAAKGTFALSEGLREAQEITRQWLVELGFRPSTPMQLPRIDDPKSEPIEPMWSLPRHYTGHAKRFIDYQNDTTVADIAIAAQEGYRSIEHVKRYTALGFGTDQGKMGNINGLGILADILETSPGALGTTTYRPMYTPVSFGVIAGSEQKELYDPVRTTSIHPWHEEQGAQFEVVGQWLRPHYYPHLGESMQDAVRRESLATRQGAGILDATTLGKIDIQGRDALAFLERIYTNDWKTLAIGQCRYGLMLGEDGMVMDDGITARLAEHHYHMTTTTGGAAGVLAWLERWQQTEWPELEVFFTSTTDQWATLAIAGPRSRDIVAKLCHGIDLSASAFPFMSWREGLFNGDIPVRVFRVSFSGELSYEINIPADYGLYAWERALEAGAPYHLTPYGTETMHVLRAEKGFIIVGQDTDGSVTPHDLGMHWILSKQKDFIGKRSLSRPDLLRADRKELVGLLPETQDTILPEGGQIVDTLPSQSPTPMLGHVTSSYFSATLGRPIALALVRAGRKRMGETVQIWQKGGRALPAVISSPVFYDKQGMRQND